MSGKSLPSLIAVLTIVCSWAILRNTIDTIYDHGEQMGDYIFMKDPSKAVMKLYKKTSDDVEEEEDEEEL